MAEATVGEIQRYLESQENPPDLATASTIKQLQQLTVDAISDLLALLRNAGQSLKKGSVLEPFISGENRLHGLEASREDLERHLKNVSDLCFKVCFVGSVKAGKSTIVNAIIGQSMAPTDAEPCTVVPTIIRNDRRRRTDVHKGELQLSQEFQNLMAGCAKDLWDAVSTERGFHEHLEKTLGSKEDLRNFYLEWKKSDGAVPRHPDLNSVQDLTEIHAALSRFNSLFRLCGIARQELTTFRQKGGDNQEIAESTMASLEAITKLTTQDFPVVTVPFALNNLGLGDAATCAGTLEIVDTPGRDELQTLPEIADIVRVVISQSQCVVVVCDCSKLGTDAHHQVKDALRAAKNGDTPVFVLGNKFDQALHGKPRQAEEVRGKLERQLATEIIMNPKYAEGSVEDFSKRVSCISGHKAYLRFAMKKVIDSVGGVEKMSCMIRDAFEDEGRSLPQDVQNWLEEKQIIWKHRKSVESLADPETIEFTQEDLEEKANFKDFQTLIVDTLQRNVGFRLLDETVSKVEHVIGGMLSDMNMLLRKQCSTADSFEREKQEFTQQLGRLQESRASWSQAVSLCKSNSSEAVRQALSSVRATMRQRAADFFSKYERDLGRDLLSEIKAFGPEGYYYRFRTDEAASKFMAEVRGNLINAFQDELQNFLMNVVEAAITNLRVATEKIQETNMSIPPRLREMLHFQPPSLDQVKADLTEKLALRNLDNLASVDGLAKKKKWGYAQILLYTLTFGLKRVNDEYQVHTDNITSMLCENCMDKLRAAAPGFTRVIDDECDQLYSGMAKYAVDRQRELEKVYEAASRPLDDVTLRALFNFYKEYAGVSNSIRAVKVTCQQLAENGPLREEGCVFAPSLWGAKESLSRVQAYSEACPETKLSMLRQISFLPIRACSYDDSNDAADVLVRAFGENSEDLRAEALASAVELLNDAQIHTDVQKKVLGGLIAAMRDFGDLEIAEALKQKLDDAECSSMQQMIHDGFEEIADAAFIKAELLLGLETMLGRGGLKGDLLVLTKGAAKEMVLSMIKQKMGDAAAKSAMRVGMALQKAVIDGNFPGESVNAQCSLCSVM